MPDYPEEGSSAPQEFPVYGIEFMHNLFCLLQHRHLILANRNDRCLKRSDISRLADRIGEKTNRDTGLEIPHLDFGFYRRISLKPRHCHQVHIIE